MLMEAICMENSSNKTVIRRADVIFLQHLCSVDVLLDMPAR